jgi:hypothetical protein
LVIEHFEIAISIIAHGRLTTVVTLLTLTRPERVQSLEKEWMRRQEGELTCLVGGIQRAARHGQ